MYEFEEYFVVTTSSFVALLVFPSPAVSCMILKWFSLKAKKEKRSPIDGGLIWVIFFYFLFFYFCYSSKKDKKNFKRNFFFKINKKKKMRQLKFSVENSFGFIICM